MPLGVPVDPGGEHHVRQLVRRLPHRRRTSGHRRDPRGCPRIGQVHGLDIGGGQPAGSAPGSAPRQITSRARLAASMYSSRAGGQPGSSGRYAAPASQVAKIAVTISAPRSRHSPTTCSGPAPARRQVPRQPGRPRRQLPVTEHGIPAHHRRRVRDTGRLLR